MHKANHEEAELLNFTNDDVEKNILGNLKIIKEKTGTKYLSSGCRIRQSLSLYASHSFLLSFRETKLSIPFHNMKFCTYRSWKDWKLKPWGEIKRLSNTTVSQRSFFFCWHSVNQNNLQWVNFEFVHVPPSTLERCYTMCRYVKLRGCRIRQSFNVHFSWHFLNQNNLHWVG